MPGRYPSLGIRKTTLLLFLALVVLAPRSFAQSVAIFPFENSSGDTADFWLSLGFPFGIAYALEEVKDLRILDQGRTQSALIEHGLRLGYAVAPGMAIEIGKDLNADLIVMGSFRRKGNRIKITTDLLDVKNGELLGTFKVEGRYKDILVLQNDLVQRLARKIKPDLTQEESESIKRSIMDPGSPEAFEHLWRGFLIVRRWEGYEKAEAEFRKAIELNPEFSRAHEYMYYVLVEQGRLDEAEQEIKEAIRIRPDEASYRYRLASMLRKQNRLDEAAREISEIININPDDPEAHYRLGIIYWEQEKHEEAKKELLRAIELSTDQGGWKRVLGALLFIFIRPEALKKGGY